MKRIFFAKQKTLIVFIALLCVVVLLIAFVVARHNHRPTEPQKTQAPPGVTTATTTAATTATNKDEPLATVTGDETTGTTTENETSLNESLLNKTETTIQGSSASVTKTTGKATSVTKTTAKKTSATKAETTKTTKTTAGKKDYLDLSQLTYTQEDVGKVVGYSSLLKEDITVVKVKEGYNGSGLKGVRVSFSDGTNTCLVECGYCHKMPCPDGGDEECSKYDVKLDGAKTCQRCGLPIGDGYNDTCHQKVDWANGGKVSCRHYD